MTEILIEPLYFYKRDNKRHYVLNKITENQRIENAEYDFDFDKTNNNRREKVFVSKEIENIEKNDKLTPDEKETEIVNTYLLGVMECIKYHFKQDIIIKNKKQDQFEYDIELINEILSKTKNTRFYSRFGSLRGEASLNFSNPSRKKKNDELDKE